jgi:NADH-quinone oxidoreductase subunit C
MTESNTYLDTVRNDIQDLIVDVRGYASEMTIEVLPQNLRACIQTLKEKFGFNYLTDITASDHYTDTGRFEVAYNLTNLDEKQRIRVATRVEEDDPEVDSITDLYTAANWREREAYDMIGIRFANHPDLRRMFMPEDFEYFPLRKEFPLLGIPGTIQMPEKDGPKEYK